MGLFLSLSLLGVASPIFAGDQAVPEVGITLFSDGHFEANYGQMVAGGKKRQAMIPIPVALLHHPLEGWILFDTGLGSRFEEQLANSWWHRLWQKLLPYRWQPSETAVARIRAMGLSPEMVRYIILSHLHYDHAGGLLDFPKAKILLSEEEWERGQGSPWRAELRGYRQEQYLSLRDRVALVEYPLISDVDPFETSLFEVSLDLFGDGSLILLSTPGHTPGHQSLLITHATPCPDGLYKEKTIHRSKCPVLLTGDAVWVRDNYQKPAPKGWFVRHFEEDEKTAWETTLKIHDYARQHPETVIIPGHDPDIRQFQ